MDDNRVVFSKLDIIWNYWIYSRHYFWKMKKLLGIIVLTLLLSDNVYAGCKVDLDSKVDWVEIADGKKDTLLFIFKNKSNKNIIIEEMGLKSKNGTIMRSEKPDPEPYDPKKASQRIGEEDFYLEPFGVSRRLIFVSNLNLDVAGNAFYRCKYGTRAVVTKQNKKSSSSSSTKQKEQSETSGSSKSLLKKLLGKD